MDRKYWFLKISTFDNGKTLVICITVWTNGLLTYEYDGSIEQFYLTPESVEQLQDYLFKEENLLYQVVRDNKFGAGSSMRSRIAVRKASKRLLDGYARNNFINHSALVERVLAYIKELPTLDNSLD